MQPLGARIDSGQVVSTEVEPFPPLLATARSGHGSAIGLANKGRIAPYLRSLLHDTSHGAWSMTTVAMCTR
jgi:hypothetical protein